MSSLIVEVCEVLEVNPHPNADRLEILLLKGWNVVAQKGLVKQGDPVVYFPPDSVLSEELADRLGIRKYLGLVKEDDVVKGYKVSAARLRGVASFGTIDHLVPDGCSVGDDLTEFYGVTKYEPPIKDVPGDCLPNHPKFHRYTDIENIRNHKDVFKDGEFVVMTEKIHGTNCRIGIVEGEVMAGSHNLRREPNPDSLYGKPLGDSNMLEMLRGLYDELGDVVVFGEIYGSGVIDLAYGLKNGEKAFRVFDIAVGGKYLDRMTKTCWCSNFDVKMVPTLYEGPFSWDLIERHTDGPTTLCEPQDAGKFKGREGIIVTPSVERSDPSLGRVILKSKSADFESRKGGTDGH